MIHTPKIKSLAKKNKKHLQSLYYLGIVLLFTLCMALLMIAEPASGEAPILPQIATSTPNGAQDTNQDKARHIAVSGQPEPIQVTGDPDKEALKALIIREAEKAGYQAPLFAIRIAQCESSLNPSAIGDHGQSYGMWQIHLPSHPTITKSQALDPQWSTEWAMKQLAAGRASLWTCARLLN